MKLVNWILAGFIATSTLAANAEIVEVSPSPLQQSSKNVTLTYHADQGTAGLKGLTSDVYTHIGVVTNKSNGGWTYAPSKWGDNSDKYALEFVSTDTWKLTIGDIRTYFGITDPEEEVLKLAMVFRNGDCSKEGKGPGGSDIFIDVHPDRFAIEFTSTAAGSILTKPGSVSFTVSSTEEADLSIAVNGSEIKKGKGTSLTADYTFTAGEFEVTATANNGSTTVTEVKNYLVAPAATAQNYPGGTPKMGAVKNADGSVTFCLAAPGKESVIIVGAWDDYAALGKNVMHYQDYEGYRYFWTTVQGLESGKYYPYYFVVDGTIKVADPYAHLVLDQYSDKWLNIDLGDLPKYPYDRFDDTMLAVYCDTMDDYDWEVTDFEIPAHDQLVIYELLVRDFDNPKSNGDGTLAGVHGKLNYLKSLGVNAIQLLPIMEFNGNNSWGYNPNFYFAPDKAYGTPDDYKEFIDKCHANGIAVILDVVFNQSDWQHPWYRMYNVGSNPMFNASAPHAYSVLNDWNQGHPLVRQQWKDCVQYWLREYNVDGFRFDLVKGLGDNDSYANNGDSGTNAYNASRVANMKAITLAVQEIEPDAYCINENLAGAKEENEMAAFGMLNWANVNYSGCQYAKGISTNTNFNRFYAPFDGGRKIGSTVSYLESHDEQRLAYEQDTYGIAAVKGNTEVSMHRLGSAAAQMIMAPGSHMIWMFSEMGNAENTKNATGGNNTDPKIVNWNLLDDPDHEGLMKNYSELINVRLANQEMYDIQNGAKVAMKCTDSAWANGRTIINTYGDKELYTVINPNVEGGNITVSVEFKSNDNNNYRIVSKSFNSNPTFSAQANTVTVAPNCYVVIASENVPSGVEGINMPEAADLMVRATRGMIVVDNAPDTVYVFGADGRLAATLPAGTSSVSLPAGIYILTSAGNSVKAAVR